MVNFSNVKSTSEKPLQLFVRLIHRTPAILICKPGGKVFRSVSTVRADVSLPQVTFRARIILSPA